MAMGMSYEQFWDASPYLSIYYRKAYRLKREAENEAAWIQGLYFYDAVAVCLSNVLKKRGQKKENYIEKPLDIFPLTKKERKRREREEYERINKQLQTLQKAQKAKNQKQGGG